MPAKHITVSLQYLEGGQPFDQISPSEASELLREALKRLPVTRLLLGWGVPERLVAACSAVCRQAGVELYLWQPLLTGDGQLLIEPSWRATGLSGKPVGGFLGKNEFTFACPNHPAAAQAVLEHLMEAARSGPYQGIFLDRIRFPSPTASLEDDLACFCPFCKQAAAASGIDLESIRLQLLDMIKTPQGSLALASWLISPPGMIKEMPRELKILFTFRAHSLTRFVRKATQLLHLNGLHIGLDCFSPTLALTVGQDLPALSASADWLKVMAYTHAYGPASLPFELYSLANWLVSQGISEHEALDSLAQTTGWKIPPSLPELRKSGLHAEVLPSEIEHIRSLSARDLLVGLDMVEVPGVCELQLEQVRADVQAVISGRSEGLALSWDLRHIPLERLELIREVIESS